MSGNPRRAAGERQTEGAVKLRLHQDEMEAEALPAAAEGSCIAAVERSTRIREKHVQETTI